MNTQATADTIQVGFCVLYRFRVRPQAEQKFIAAWGAITAGIRAEYGGLGSRLHRADDGLWWAYAQWPDQQAWERAGQLGPVDAQAAEQMGEALLERFPPIALTPVRDMLSLYPATSGVAALLQDAPEEGQGA